MGKKGKLIVSLGIAVGALVITPCSFSCIFHGSGSSSFLNCCETSISVENWFSFWITFLAGAASVAVAVIALNISTNTEKARIKDRLNIERLYFIPTKVVMPLSMDAPMLTAYMPRDIALLNDAHVCKVDCKYDNDNSISLEVHEHLDVCAPHFTMEVSANGKKEIIDMIEHWKVHSGTDDDNQNKLDISLAACYRGLNYHGGIVTYGVEIRFWLKYFDDEHIDILNSSAKTLSTKELQLLLANSGLDYTALGK